MPSLRLSRVLLVALVLTAPLLAACSGDKGFGTAYENSRSRIFITTL